MQPSSLSRNVLYMPGPSSRDTVWVMTNDGSSSSFSLAGIRASNWRNGCMKRSRRTVALGMLVDARIAGRDRQRRYRLRARDGAQDTVQDAVAEAAAQFAVMSVHDKQTLQQMIDYAQAGQCRWRTILAYYGDTPSMQRCGVCDNCMNPPQINPADPSIAVDKTLLGADASAAASKLHAWSPGDAVRVPRFGAGEVALTSGEQVAIVFPDGKTRTFMSGYVKAARQSRRHNA
jgi:ATP-dependent DNA helicase RecQ